MRTFYEEWKDNIEEYDSKSISPVMTDEIDIKS